MLATRANVQGMTVDPRAALDRFIAALEVHYVAVVNRRSDNDRAVDVAYDVLEDALDVYDEALAVVHSEATPFFLTDDDDDDDDDNDDDDDGDDDDDDDDDNHGDDDDLEGLSADDIATLVERA